MKRLYTNIFKQQLAEHRQMVFAMGPRQSGKTTIAQGLQSYWPQNYYFSWDNVEDREKIVAGPRTVGDMVVSPQLASASDKSLVIFDEIHKFTQWRDFIKGFYDTFPGKVDILVTGSAKLGTFNRGGDSLMGRYFPYRVHPLSVAELAHEGNVNSNELWTQPQSLDEAQFQALWQFGGFPEPFLKNNQAFTRRWQKLRKAQLLEEEVRDLTRIHDIARLELLTERLRHQAGSLLSYQSLAQQLRVTDNTVRAWLNTLSALYYSFELRPYSTNIVRSLLKEPKYYLWDWSLCIDDGSRAENMVALHLLKAVHLWTDLGLGDYDLHYIRDKEKREVDFLVSKEGEPWMLVST